MGNTYVRLAIFQLDEVLPHVPVGSDPTRKERPVRIFAGREVYLDSMRYQTFVVSGPACVLCGIKGEFFALEKHHNAKHDRFHLNLYAQKEGAEILLTKDHILPKSKGGKDILSNFQTMCAPCNDLKGNFIATDASLVDPRKLQHMERNRNLQQIASVKARIDSTLAGIRQNGAKLYDAKLPGGGPLFLEYHQKHHARKQFLKGRLAKLEQFRLAILARYEQLEKSHDHRRTN